MDRSGNHHAIVRGRIDIILHVVGAHQIDVVPFVPEYARHALGDERRLAFDRVIQEQNPGDRTYFREE